ncbi:MAG: hypothetical protein BBJ57_10685 [Desulfobacterales bacterium PC51MH44]|nr:MAG: hypothetical protein BBJ57_10685 [Desulfobacterales bacterium PC51MH44]
MEKLKKAILFFFSFSFSLVACTHLNAVNKASDNSVPKHLDTFQTRAFVLPWGLENVPKIEEREILAGEPAAVEDAAALPAAIVAALLPSLIDKGVDLAASALREASKAETVTAASTANGYFYKIDAIKLDPLPYAKGRRLIIVRGKFGPNNGKVKNFKSQFWKSTEAQKLAKTIGLIEDPAFYYEAYFHFTFDNSAFRLISLLLEHNQFIKSSLAFSKRDLVLSFLFKGPSKDNNIEGFALGLVKVDNLKKSTRLNLEALVGHETAWMPLMPLDKKITQLMEGAKQRQIELAKVNKEIEQRKAELNPPDPEPEPIKLQDEIDDLTEALDAKRLELEKKIELLSLAGNKPDELKAAKKELTLFLARQGKSRELSKKKERIENLEKVLQLEKQRKTINDLENSAIPFFRRLSPYMVEVTIHETRNGNKFLAFAADVLDTSKESVKQAVKAELVPAERERIKAEEEAERIRKEQETTAATRAALVALHSVKIKQQALDDLQASGSASAQAILEAQLALEQAKFDANTAYRKAGLEEPYPDVF